MEENNLKIKFNPDAINIERIINYIFSNYHPKDIKITSIGIEDIVKEMLKRKENNDA